MIKNEKTSILYSEIRKIVWGFADMVRDKGNGTTEDYAKIVLPTCLIKRTLDLQEEFNKKFAGSHFDLVSAGVTTSEQALLDVNAKSYRFYDSGKLSSGLVEPAAILITWKDLINFPDNPNAEERRVGQGAKGEETLLFEQIYKTKATDFVSLMFEIVEAFNPLMKYVFDTFEYKQLLVQKSIVPFKDFYNTCQFELSKHNFNLENISTDLFSDIYMDLIGRFAHDSGKKGGEFFTPTPLVKNAWQFIDIESYAKQLVSGAKTSLKIGDPTAGSNTFLIYGYDLIKEACDKLQLGAVSKEAFQFYGQELKGFQYCLGLINMIFHGVVEQYNVGVDIKDQNSNVISNYFNGIGREKESLDIVVANPPYGTKNYGIEYAEGSKITDDRWKYGVPKKQEGEQAFLMTIYNLLNKQGKSVVVMPLGTLFRDSGAAIRGHLLKEDVVEGIVALPGNMFLTTSIPVVLWILNKNKKEQDKGKVFMVNASKDFKKVGKFNDWNPTKAIESYLTRTGEEDYSGYVDFSVLEKNKFNLSIQRYFSKEKEREVIDILALEKEILELENEINGNKADISFIMNQILEIEARDE